jgi:K+ transporter
MCVTFLMPDLHQLTRSTQGAWAPLMLAVILMSIMLFWTWAKVRKPHPRVHPLPTNPSISDWKTGSTVQTGETFVTSSTQEKKA